MHLVRVAERRHSPNEEASGTVRLERLLDAQQPDGARLALVHFHDGAVTHWHTHPGEQILLVVSGVCRYGSAHGVQGEAHPGDTIYVAPGEKHWHGAARGHDMSHLSVTTVGPPVWLEPYEGA
jgi:quercetin dioxygenase-like cupin family protein